jgi:1-aminocyclopropane-1-carboxylate deaminase
MTVQNQKIVLDFPNGIELHVKREDLLHPIISGNKFRKLKYNILEAKRLGHNKLLTFGGAFPIILLLLLEPERNLGLKQLG